MPVYTPRPYVRPAYTSDLRFGDLFRRQGAMRADAELRRGDASAQMWSNIGNTIANTVSGIAREREEAPIRAMQRENITLENQSRKAEARDSATAKQIQGSALRQGEDGVWTYDRDYLTRAFQEAGIADRLPSVLEGLDAFDNSARAVNKAKQEGLAGLAYGVTQLGNTPAAFNQAIELALKNGFITRKDVGPILQKVVDDPAKIGEIAMALASSSPTFAAKLAPKEPKLHNVPAGTSVIDPNNPQAGPVFTAPAAERTAPNPTEASLAAAAAAGDASAAKALQLLRQQSAPQRDTEPLVPVIGDDGQPVLMPRSQAVGRRPASTREQGRPVTSGDAGRIADLDTALDDLATLTGEVGTVAGSTGTRAKIGASLPNWVTEWTGRGANAKSKQAVIDRVKQVIGKALEGGVLRKEDEIKYEKILPVISDVPEVVTAKLEGLVKAIEQRRSTFVDALADAGYDTAKFSGRPPRTKTGGSGPQIGERRLIHGQMGEWDGQGWKAVP